MIASLRKRKRIVDWLLLIIAIINLAYVVNLIPTILMLGSNSFDTYLATLSDQLLLTKKQTLFFVAYEDFKTIKFLMVGILILLWRNKPQGARLIFRLGIAAFMLQWLDWVYLYILWGCEGITTNLWACVINQFVSMNIMVLGWIKRKISS